MPEFYHQDEFNKRVDLLNALNTEYSQWQYTTARKNHQDIFGDLIKESETYFKRSNGPAFDNVIKISQRSMDRLIYVLFSYNPRLDEVANYLAQERMNNLREALNRSSKVIDPE
jgi:hypothetical protein